MDGNTKLRVKVGASEFEAEGPAELIKEQYAAFLEAVRAAPSSAPVWAPPPPPPPDDSGSESKTPPGNLMLKRVFADNGAILSLLALPRTDNAEADALLLLLYGYQELRQGDYPVTGVRLMQAAKQSGLHQVKRVDRKISVNEQYILAAGAHRGRKYSLNNQGVAKAQGIIKEMIG